jgi:hypothetical protein
MREITEPPETLAERLRELGEQNAQLLTALETRIVIEQAKGILAERLNLSIEDAFTLLRQSARAERMRLHDLAMQVRPGAEMPQAIVRGMARESRWRAVAIRERSEAMRRRNDRLRAAVDEQAQRLLTRPP